MKWATFDCCVVCLEYHKRFYSSITTNNVSKDYIVERIPENCPSIEQRVEQYLTCYETFYVYLQVSLLSPLTTFKLLWKE